ncbi:GNAT family N-acetyltransferase [Cohnella ginsengisoli]|uniref:GNAT family N-acetyltransferase n=1 Tax=Cohnella ginsengisoli TaxID=425004 RepID=A0A9X4KLH9_9BACL|nr:GNAT family N-acetyltransferase [Cohnella ginsengisoli]MDG0793981.1 GNAT family N-acetyltransferase [Cohnella ginsengisoli]
MAQEIVIKQLAEEAEVRELDAAFSRTYPWYRPGQYDNRCLEENRQGLRTTLIAKVDGNVAGCCHLLYRSEYPGFAEAGIPEVNALDVLPAYRRLGIASRMLQELEDTASRSSAYIGLGVGLYRDYGAAQILYAKRGYVLDGQGIMYKNRAVAPGQTVAVDDDLLLYLIKDLTGANKE